MATLDNYHIHNHPCYSDRRESLWHRIHLPVAPKCNVKCAYCSHSVGSSCHTSKPGYSGQVMSPEAAVRRAVEEVSKDPRIHIVAVSGPGEPLANPETFESIELIRKRLGDIHLCLSTNGTLLKEKIPWLVKMGFRTLTVSMSTAEPRTAALIYEWARIDGMKLTGEEMGYKVIDEQIGGIAKAADAGITVKVNSILIPNLNHDDVIPLSRLISRAGAALQNIIPVFPNDNLARIKPPTIDQLETLRTQAGRYIEQFRHCKQCRSDVVGIPGCDIVL